MKRNTLSFVTISATSLLIAASAVADTSYFSYHYGLADEDTLDLGTVTSVGDGVVEIYSYHGGEVGNLLGTEEVHAGANSDVRVNLGMPPRTDVVAVLNVQGQTVATRHYTVFTE